MGICKVIAVGGFSTGLMGCCYLLEEIFNIRETA